MATNSIAYLRSRCRTIIFHLAMVRPYFVSVEGKYEAGPLTVFIYPERDQSCSVSLDQVESACHATAISSPTLRRAEEVMRQRPILSSFRHCPYPIRARLTQLMHLHTIQPT